MVSSSVRIEAVGCSGKPSRAQVIRKTPIMAMVQRRISGQPPAAILSAVPMLTISAVGAMHSPITATQKPVAPESTTRQRNWTRTGSSARSLAT